ncbi:hypothetical protein AB1Y20_017616 [Prymnesium parvum]|uniref:Uncharacterized protein n=1 Tax=Prymnesium parvum TaxID=97485 RepID=A0AB34JPH8_PRYPA
MRLSTPNWDEEPLIDLQLPDREDGATPSSRRRSHSRRLPLSSFVIEANEKFNYDLHLPELQGQRSRRLIERHIAHMRQQQLEASEIDETIAGLNTLMKEAASVFTLASSSSAPALMREGVAERKGGEGKRAGLARAKTVAAELAREREARAETLGKQLHVEYTVKGRATDVHERVSERIQELREDPSKLQALQREIEARRKRFEIDNLRENIRAVRLSPTEYARTRERHFSERRLLEEERERAARSRDEEHALRAARLEQKLRPMSSKELKLHKQKQHLAKRQRAWAMLIALSASSQAFHNALTSIQRGRLRAVEMDAAATKISRCFKRWKLVKRVQLVKALKRMLKLLVFRWRLRKFIEQKQTSVGIIRSVLRTTLERGRFLRVVSSFIMYARRVQRAWRRKADIITAQKLLVLQAWLRRDLQRGLTETTDFEMLDPMEKQLRLAVVTADLWDRRRQHVRELNKYFREKERREKAAAQLVRCATEQTSVQHSDTVTDDKVEEAARPAGESKRQSANIAEQTTDSDIQKESLDHAMAPIGDVKRESTQLHHARITGHPIVELNNHAATGAVKDSHPPKPRQSLQGKEASSRRKQSVITAKRASMRPGNAQAQPQSHQEQLKVRRGADEKLSPQPGSSVAAEHIPEEAVPTSDPAASLLSMPVFQPLVISDSHYTKLTGKLRARFNSMEASAHGSLAEHKRWGTSMAAIPMATKSSVFKHS